MTTKQKPVHVVKLGLVEAAIWKNGTAEKPFFNVTLRRHYSVEQNGQTEWRSTDSFGRDDLLLAAKVLDLAHSWVCERTTKRELDEPNEAELERVAELQELMEE